MIPPAWCLPSALESAVGRTEGGFEYESSDPGQALYVIVTVKAATKHALTCSFEG